MWRKHFTDLAVITMDVVTKQLLLWIPNIIELDQVRKQFIQLLWLQAYESIESFDYSQLVTYYII